MPQAIKQKLKPFLRNSIGFRYPRAGSRPSAAPDLPGELAICFLVERCHILIRKKLVDYFISLRREIPDYLNCSIKSGVSSPSTMVSKMLAASGLMELLSEIQQSIDRETQKYFAVPMKLSGNMTIERLEDYLEVSKPLFREYRHTMQMSHFTEMLSKQVWARGYDALHSSWIADIMLERISLGSLFLGSVGCSAREQHIRCQAEMGRQLSGTFELLRHQLSRELCDITARSIYGQYDLLMRKFALIGAVVPLQSREAAAGKQKLRKYDREAV